MNHDRTYRPVPHVPAPCLQDANGSIRQAPRRFAGYAAIHPVQPMKGLPGTRATDVSYRASVPAGHAGRGVALSYRALAPGGAGFCYRICAGTSESRPTANYSLLTANSTYTFSAKEKDSETGLSYFGSRYYSSDLSIWLSVDPMSDKYASLSPYVYCADNPVRLVDPDGEHFEVVVEENTITIKATYYTQKDNKQLLQKGLDYWNNEQSGKYSYVTGTGENQKTYTIRFDLRIAEQEFETDDAARSAAELSPSKSNNYVELSVPGYNNKGATTYGNIIQLHPEKSSEQTLHHEIGHTLGMYDTPLFNSNLMYSKGDKDNVTKVNIKHMLKNCFENRTILWCIGGAKHVGKCVSKIGKKFHGKVISNQ